MAVSVEEQQQEEPPIAEQEPPSSGEDEEEDDGEDFEEEDEKQEDDDDDEPLSCGSRTLSERVKMESLFRQISTERLPLRVHDVLIRGNTKTKDSLIEAEVEALRNATSIQELIWAASIANSRLRCLGIFDSASITLDSGPPWLPGAANVIVEVVETKSPLVADCSLFSKPEARSWSLDGSLKLKNLFGFGDLWDGYFAYGWDKISELSAGVYLPRFKRMATPVLARASILSKDWLKFSSYKERAVGLSVSLISSRNHDLLCNLSWHTLDPSQQASQSMRRQLGHGLISSLKYAFKIDKRDYPRRPTRGYAFFATSQIVGLLPDYRSSHLFHQDFELRYAFPLGFHCAALNFGLSCRVIFPFGSSFFNRPSSLSETFFLGGKSSTVCTLGGPLSFLGFKSRGLGSTEPRMKPRGNSNDECSNTDSGRDFPGGDLTVTAFADLSFNLPSRVFQEAGIRGHLFACAGNVSKLTDNAYRDFSFQKFTESFRSSAGFGIIVPTRLFSMEVNYCYIVKQLQHDHGKTGLQFSFSSKA
ncbi:uncharacterized protein LOC127798230 [Diospyros lotus]|uniref:uncharacterized protein LOC127798230 n=1 Tax=Diospyros lotus TaxID=55363 RepID=UPI0022543659|nr:uncharacterized protein LOC127798230 [Diospyros lotus]